MNAQEWRALWAECCNKQLERDRIEHRSYARQGITQEPAVHESYVAHENGGISDCIRINEEIRSGNKFLKQYENEIKAIDEEISCLQAEKKNI